MFTKYTSHTLRVDSCPPKSHACNLTLLYDISSTLEPIVGVVLTNCPIDNLYNIVVFPAFCIPNIIILKLFLLRLKKSSILNY